MYSPLDFWARLLQLPRDSVRSSGPVERLTGLVVGHKELLEFVVHCFDAENTAGANGLPSVDPSPALQLVEPAGIGWCAEHIEAQPLDERDAPCLSAEDLLSRECLWGQ